MKILVTGANGFIGRALCEYLTANRYDVLPVVRHTSNIPNEYILNDFDKTSWNKALDGCDSVVHLAGLAHIMDKQNANNSHNAFHSANVSFTKMLADNAVAAGVRRFIFISTVKVNGEYTEPGISFSSNDLPNPKANDEYAISKLKAEQSLQKIAKETGLELVIIRPPLVYGPGVKGNFLSLLKMLDRGLPLPFGAIHNQRSLVGLNNLIDLIITCLNHPAANNQIFFVSDNEDLSTTVLLKRMGKALNKPSRLIPISSNIFKIGLNIIGKKNLSQRLLENLQIDTHQTKELLNWSPPSSVDDELQRTTEWYLKQK